MSEPAYNSQMITQYLLGQLLPADIERFDQLSIADDEFADALNAAENDLVDAYARDELTGPDLERFRSYYLASPLRRQKLGFAEAFQAWSQRNETALAERIRPEQPEKTGEVGWFSGLNVFSTPRASWQWGAAFVAITLMVAVGWLVFEKVRVRQQVSQTAARDGSGTNERPLQSELESQRLANEKAERELARVRAESERLEQERKNEEERQRLAEHERTAKRLPGAVSIASFVLAPQMRGAGQLQTVSLPAGTDYVAMELQLEPNDYSTYRIVLIDQSSRHIPWRSRNLKASGAGDRKAIAIRFGAGLLKPQTGYVLRVTGIPDSGAPDIVGDYPFRVVK